MTRSTPQRLTGRRPAADRVLWREQTPELPDRSGRALPDAADVVVIGGGYTGLAAARQLARRGVRVTLLEAERLGFGASTRNGGMILPGFKHGLGALSARHGRETAIRLYRETLDAIAHLERLTREEAIDANLDLRGHLELAWGPGHAADHERDRAELAEVGVEARVMRRADLVEEIGTPFYFGGLAIESGGGVHPARLHAGLATAAARAGADLHERIRARTVRSQADGRFVVETSRGALIAREVVVATNGYTDGSVPDLRRRVVPIGSYIITTEPLSEDLAREISPRGRMFFDTKNFLYYWRLTPDRRLLFGGRASFEPTSVERTARILEQGMLQVHPQVRGVRVTHAWGGKVGFTWDRMPHVGRTRRGLVYAMGYCGTGVALATYLGHRAADWMLGGPAPVLSGLRFPLVPAPYEGHAWFLPFVGEWYRRRDRQARAGGPVADVPHAG